MTQATYDWVIDMFARFNISPVNFGLLLAEVSESQAYARLRTHGMTRLDALAVIDFMVHN